MFYGATDALLDASLAAQSYGAITNATSGANLLLCYGFLQALYIQQDSVLTLSRALGLKWHPNSNDRLKEIRDIRNRLTGHPSSAGENGNPPRPSSAIIPYNDISPNGFRGHIYYEDGFEDITIDVDSMLRDNEMRLSLQMQQIEQKMDDRERDYREEKAKQPFLSSFGTGFDYLVQRLWCDLTDESRVPQAQTHAKMIRERITALRDDLSNRGFQPESRSLDIIFSGIDLLEKILDRSSPSASDQDEFNLIYDGLEKRIRTTETMVRTLDISLKTPVS
jgi:hypothetical protein